MAHGVGEGPPARPQVALPDLAADPIDAGPASPRVRASRPAARLPDIDAGRCTGCGWCVAACDLHLLSLEVRHWRKTSVLHEPGRCTGCSLCAVRCPFHVITMRAPSAGHARDGAAAAPDQPVDGR